MAPQLMDLPDPAPWSTLRKMIGPQATPFRAVLTREQAQRLDRPVIPESMEDKWVLYRHKDRVRVHRSWTGYMVHEFRLAPTTRVGFEGGLEVVETLRSTTPSPGPSPQFPEAYAGHVLGFLQWLISRSAITIQSMFRLPAEKAAELGRDGPVSQEAYQRALEENQREMIARRTMNQRLTRITCWMEESNEQKDH